MKMKWLKYLFIACLFYHSSFTSSGQSCIPVNMNGTIITIACPQTCTPLTYQVPHIKNTTDYRVVSIPYNPYPFTTPGGNEPAEIYVDDKFSHLNSLPFPVCFFGTVFNSFVIGSNGVVSFDASQADCNNDYRLDFGPATPGVPQPIPHTGTGTCIQTNNRKYPAFSIMGPYHDLNPNTTATTPDRKVEWRTEGTAPCRKLIISFYQIALFGDINSVNTSQIAVHESTGIIDVFIETKKLDQSGGAPWNADFAILGIQKDNSTAIAVPGKNCTVWQEDNTAYRFIPSGAGSLYVSTQLLTLSGSLVAIADTATTITGLLDINFPSVCPPTGSTQYVIKTTFKACNDPAVQLISLDTVTFNLSNSLYATAVSTNTDCGPPNGTITITIPPGYGNPPFTFVMDGGTPFSGVSPYTLTGVPMGPHTITISDATGTCFSSINISVQRNNGLLAATATTQASCSNVYNGTIKVTALNGTGPFTFQLDGFLPAAGSNPYTFTNVNGGSHNIVIYDATGCQSGIIAVDVPVGAGVNGSTSSVAATCPTVSNGKITVTAIAGTPPYTYQLDSGTPQSGGNPYTFTNVSPGPHSVLITDFMGCTRLFTLTVNAGPVLTASSATTATVCFGASNGTVSITPVNGAGPFSYSLDGVAPVAGTAPYTFTNVGAGLHNYQVFDAVGCASIIYPVMVDPGPALVTTANHTDVLCNGDATGSIRVNPPPLGQPPYQYSINSGVSWQSSPMFNALTAGAYTVFFRSFNGCQGTLPVTINEPAAITASPVLVRVQCNGESNGSITVNISGGTAPYQYSINNGTSWQSNNNFIVPAGNYDILIRDANNCRIINNITMTEPAPLTAFAVNQNASCDGGNDGRIIVNASGGNASYQYSIDGVSFQSSPVFNTAPGTYRVWVKDNLGCTTSFNTTVGLTVNLFLDKQSDAEICEGKEVLLQTVSNATIYAWTPGVGLNDTTLANPLANPAATSTYQLKAVLGRCTAFDTVIVYVNTAPIADAGADGDICYGQSYILQGSGGMQYTWTPPLYLNTVVGANPVSTPSRTTVYTLSVTDPLGCKSLFTDDVTVKVKRTMVIRTFPFDTIAHAGDQFQLLASSPGILYNWSPSAGLNKTDIPNPIVTTGQTGDEMLYQVIAVDAEGCKAEGYVRIRIYKGPDIYVPTGFTPDGDGLNDLFTPVPVGIQRYNYFRVFNRWGQLVFSTNRMNTGWNGTIAGKEQGGGSYIWMVEGVTKDNRLITKKGTVLLIR